MWLKIRVSIEKRVWHRRPPELSYNSKSTTTPHFMQIETLFITSHLLRQVITWKQNFLMFKLKTFLSVNRIIFEKIGAHLENSMMNKSLYIWLLLHRKIMRKKPLSQIVQWDLDKWFLVVKNVSIFVVRTFTNGDKKPNRASFLQKWPKMRSNMSLMASSFEKLTTISFSIFWWNRSSFT